MRFTGGKFSSLKDEVVYRVTLNGFHDAETGSVQDNGIWFAKVVDFYGFDYLVREDDRGAVSVDRFDHVDIDDGGYFCPIEREWALVEELVSAWYGDDEEVED